MLHFCLSSIVLSFTLNYDNTMEWFITFFAVVVIGLVLFLVRVREIAREKEIEHAKTEFVSLISHQLRTPPSTIKWYAEMLLKDEKKTLTDDQKRYIRQISTSSQQMIALTNALLNISRLEMGSFAIEPENCDLVAITKQVLEEQKIQIQEKKLQVKEEYEQNLPQVTTDPKFVSLIMKNLLTNAINFTAENGQITISLAKDGKDHVKICVTDTGCGIPKSQQAKIFEKLFRADNARMIDRKGNGLGLYITKFIIKQIGGTITFISEENKGTTFTVTLPLVSSQKKREGMRLD